MGGEGVAGVSMLGITSGSLIEGLASSESNGVKQVDSLLSCVQSLLVQIFSKTDLISKFILNPLRSEMMKPSLSFGGLTRFD